MSWLLSDLAHCSGNAREIFALCLQMKSARDASVCVVGGVARVCVCLLKSA